MSVKKISRARRAAHQVLLRVARDGAYADRALDAVLERSGLQPRDRNLVTELVYGTLRSLANIDFILSTLATRPLSKMPASVLVAMRLGAYQILYMRVPARAAVNESVALVSSDHRFASGFVNAVLRKLAVMHEAGEVPQPRDSIADPLEALAVESSHPLWLLREVQRQRGAEVLAAFVAANNERPPLSLRVNVQRATREEVAKSLLDYGCEVELPERFPSALLVRNAGAVSELPGFLEGHFSVQDLAAQLVAVLAEPHGAMTILDLCAAPGGKTCHLAELDPEGLVIAVDLHPAKTRLIAQSAERLGLTNIVVAAADATNHEAIEDVLFDHKREEVDLIVVDAPCSGMGTLRRNPELRSQSETAVTGLCKLQDNILDTAALLVRSGGHIVYSVCTTTDAEGNDRVKAFLERHPEMSRVDPPDHLKHFVDTCNGYVGSCLRTWPDIHGTDGFFAARLRKQ